MGGGSWLLCLELLIAVNYSRFLKEDVRYRVWIHFTGPAPIVISGQHYQPNQALSGWHFVSQKQCSLALSLYCDSSDWFWESESAANKYESEHQTHGLSNQLVLTKRRSWSYWPLWSMVASFALLPSQRSFRVDFTICPLCTDTCSCMGGRVDTERLHEKADEEAKRKTDSWRETLIS